MPRCPRTMTQQQWSAYKARIIREAHEQQAAVIRAAFVRLCTGIVRLAKMRRVLQPLQRQELERR